MWIFGKKTPKGADDKKAVSAPLNSKEEKVQALLAQMREIRAEIGEENLQKLAEKLQFDALKKQVRDDIDNDPRKRDKLIDHLRWHANEGE